MSERTRRRKEMRRRKWLNAAVAWVLAAMTAVTSVPLDAYAAEDTPVTQVTAQEEVEGEPLEEQEKEGEPDAEDPGEEEQDVSEGEKEETDEEENSEQEEESQDQDSQDEDSQDGEDADENNGEETDGKQEESVSENSVSENTIELEEGNTVTRVLSEDSMGRILAQNIEIDNSQSSLEAYGVSQVEITGQTAVVSYKAVEEADLVVAIYEEGSGKMAASGHKRVEAHGITAEVALYGEEMPQYYTVQAYLTDPISNRPLCRVYKDEDHTQIMQEFYAKKESEFDQDRLYSLDESEDNNFAVFGKDVLIFHEGEAENQFVSADEDNRVYEFDKADEKLKNIQPGQIMAFFYQDESKTPIVAKVYEIQIDGEKVKITGMDTSIEEVFEFLKISTGNYSAEDTDSYTANDEDSRKGSSKFKIETDTVDTEVGVTAKVEFRFWKKKVNNFAELSLTFSGSVTIKDLGVSWEGKLPLVSKYPIPLGQTGLSLQISIGLFCDAELTASTTIGFEKTIGSGFTQKENGEWSSYSLDSDIDITWSSGIEGEFYFGLELEANLCFLNENLLSIGATGKFGPKITASTTTIQGSTASEQHMCTVCTSLDVMLHGELSFHAIVLGKEHELLEDVLSPEIDIPIGSGYYSPDADPVSGWGECPNKSYYCVVTVLDQDGKPVRGAVVDGDSNLVTDRTGKVWIAPQADKQVITASKDGVTGSALYSGRKQVTIRLGIQASQIKVKQVELSKNHQAIVTEDGKLYVWGGNGFGQVGNGTTTECETPTLVKGLEDAEIREIQISNCISAAITTDGVLYMWGDNSYGELGIGSKANRSTVAKRVEGLKNVKKVSIGGNGYNDTVAAITGGGTLYIWGYNSYGQLGDGTSTYAYTPVQPKLEEDVKVKQVALGYMHTVALSTDGQVYTWGYNSYGQLGNGTTTDSKTPVKIEIGGGKEIAEVYAGAYSTAALTVDGELYMWGNNSDGQLGDGSTTRDNTPKKVEFSNGKKVKEFLLYYSSCMALLSDGTVWAWGASDGNGRLGTGETGDLSCPSQIKNLKEIEHIYGKGIASHRVFAAINTAGDLYTWGMEYCGHNDNVEFPDKVLTGVAQVKIAWYDSATVNYKPRQAAVKDDGTLYTWGYRSNSLVENGKDNLVPQPYDLTSPVNATYQAASVEDAVEMTTDAASEGTARYDGLVAGETYNFYVMKDRDAEDSLSYDNLLYIDQGKADDAGNLSFHYVMREACSSADVFIVAMGQKDLSGASVELEDMTYTGENLYPNPVVKDGEVQLVLGRDYDLDGDYIVKEPGEYELIVKGIGQYKGVVRKTFKVVKETDPDQPKPDDYGDVRKEDIPEDGVIPEGLWISQIPEQTYTGKALKPEVRVYDYKTLLTEKKDYSISYKNNTNANDGQNAAKAPTITITGKGNYTGKETQTFAIAPRDIAAEDVICDNLTVAYNGKVQKPVPVVTWNGKKLAKNKDFTVDYPAAGLASYKEAGVYDITVTGKGNFTGTRTVSLTITEAKLLSKCKVTAIKNQTYTGTAITPEPVVKDGKTTLVKDTDYSVSYDNNKEIGKASVILTGMGKYTGVKRVDFQIVPAVAFNKAKVALKAKDGSNYTGSSYTGEEVRPDSYELTVVVKGADKKNQTVSLVEGTDYTVSYQNNVKAGKATIVFTGIGGYKGTLKKTYVIKPYDIKADQSQAETAERKIIITLDDSYGYAKGGCKPEPIVTFCGTTLTKGTDYTLTYQNNSAVNGGDNPRKVPTVTVTGKGSFTGKATAVYKITKTELSGLSMKAADKVWQKKAGVYATKIEIVDVDGKKLTAGKDYEKTPVYTYEADTKLADDIVRKAGEVIQKKDIIPAGTLLRATVQAKDGGNYSGEISATYRITKADIGKATVKIPAQTYTGKKIEPSDQIKVTLGRQTLAIGTDYEIVSYANNVNKGSASVTLRGIGDCGGTKTVKFTIKGKGFLWWWRK